MNTDRDAAQKALGELITLINNQLMSAAIFGTALREARAAGYKQEISPHVFDGDELAAKIHLNLLDRFEGLMHEGKTLDQTLELLRKEKWPGKLMNIHSQHMG